MGLVTGFIERRTHPRTGDPALIALFGGRATASGVDVTEMTALNCAAFYAGVRVLAETLASLPLITYRRLENGGKERAQDHFLYSLLHDLPNPEITSFELRETMMGHLCTWGNAYTEIVRNGAGQIVELWPVAPNRVTPMRDKRTKELIYEIRLPDGGKDIFPRSRIHHIRGLSFEGIVGYNPVKLHRESLGLTLGAEEYAARFFGNDASPGGVLEHPAKLSDTAYKRLYEWWAENHQGLSKANHFALLEEGMKWQQTGIDPEKAQLLQTRKDAVKIIARLLRLPAHMIGELEGAIKANIEEMAIEFVIYTMLPWFRRWEQAQFRDLIPAEDRKTIFTEFLIEGLLRGKTAERYGAYAVGRQWGWLSADDVREMENQNPLPDGQGNVYWSPVNMVPSDQLGKIDNDAAEETERALEGIKEGLKGFGSTLANLQLIAERIAERNGDQHQPD